MKYLCVLQPYCLIQTYFSVIQICFFRIIRREMLRQNRFLTKIIVKIEDSKEEKLSSTNDNNPEQDKFDSTEKTTCNKVNNNGDQS